LSDIKDDAVKRTPLEKMCDFFTARVDIYDEHMLNDVDGCKEGYVKMAGLVPGTGAILDLGCGTGLELDKIFKKLRKLANVLDDIKLFM